MAGSHAQALFHAEGAHLVLCDGVCGLCSRLLRFLLAQDGRAVFKCASLQSATGREMVQRYGGAFRGGRARVAVEGARTTSSLAAGIDSSAATNSV